MRPWKLKKYHYLCRSKLVKTKPNRTMKGTKTKQPNILVKMLEDKKAIQQCIRQGGDLKQVAQKRNVKFVTPL